jgi:hypothetical protein
MEDHKRMHFLGYIKGREFTDQLSSCQLLQEEDLPLCSLLTLPVQYIIFQKLSDFSLKSRDFIDCVVCWAFFFKEFIKFDFICA